MYVKTRNLQITVMGVNYTSEPLDEDVSHEMARRMFNLYPEFKTVNALVTTPTLDFRVPPKGADVAATVHAMAREPVMAKDDFVKADNFIACDIRKIVESANNILAHLIELDIPAEAKQDLIRKMTSQGHGLDRWQYAAWQLVFVETMDNMSRTCDTLPSWTLVNGGFPAANQGDSET